MKKIKLVIELGSSNTVIYKMGNGIVLREPSIIALKKDYSEFAVGYKAKKMIGKTDENILIVNPIENGIITNENACNLMLKAFIGKVVENDFASNIEVLFCIQNGLTESEMLTFKNVAYFCDVNSVCFVSESMASALYCGFNKNNPHATISLNIGGGTVSMAVVSLGKIIEGYSIGFGGINMDSSIKDYVQTAFNLNIGLSTAEKLKIECGSLYKQDTTNLEVSGIDILSKCPHTEIIQSIDVYYAVENYFINIAKSVEQLLHLCSPDIIADITSNGIIVSGGVANIVGLEDYLSKKLNLKVFIPEQPENCAILGAAMYLNDKNYKK